MVFDCNSTHRRGFAILERLGPASVLTILFAVVVPVLATSGTQTHDSDATSAIRSAATAQVLYESATATSGRLTELTSTGIVEASYHFRKPEPDRTRPWAMGAESGSPEGTGTRRAYVDEGGVIRFREDGLTDERH